MIQIDSPGTVASFLQRMGRTGRRSGTLRNCLFLTTSDQALVRAAALVDLWNTGYVEPIVPPPLPWHLLAQQLLAITLQERGTGRRTWREWVGRMPGFAALDDDEIERVVAHMLDTDILFEDGGILGIGTAGEREFGRRHFLELMSVFTSPPLFQVLHGREDLGQVDALSFTGGEGRPRVLLLGGRSWRVTNVDWNRRVAHVERVEGRGASRWRGGGPMLGFRFCRAMRDVLAGDGDRDWWSRRAREAMATIRGEFAWLAAAGTTLRRRGGAGHADEDANGGGDADEPVWWTFAGTKANAALKAALQSALQAGIQGLVAGPIEADASALRFSEGVSLADAERAVAAVRAMPPGEILPDVDPDAVDGLKFSQCLPPELAVDILRRRMADVVAVKTVLTEPVSRSVSLRRDRMNRASRSSPQLPPS